MKNENNQEISSELPGPRTTTVALVHDSPTLPSCTPGDGRDVTIKSLRLYLDAKVEASPAVVAIFKWLVALIAAATALAYKQLWP